MEAEIENSLDKYFTPSSRHKVTLTLDIKRNLLNMHLHVTQK